jgi:hypothetical protein
MDFRPSFDLGLVRLPAQSSFGGQTMNQPGTRRDFLKAMELASISAAVAGACGQREQNKGGKDDK